MENSAKIIRATGVVTALVLIVKGLGFAEKLLLAYFFGTGMEVDAFLVAYSLPFGAYVVLREVVRAALIPTLMRTWDSSPQDGRRLVGTVGTLLLVLSGLVAVAGALIAPALVSLIAPGFAGDQRALAVRLVRLVMPALLLLSLSTLTMAALHARKRFALPALGEASFRAGPLAFLLAAGAVPAMAAGVVLGALGKLALEVAGLSRAWLAITATPGPRAGWHLPRLRSLFDFSFPPLRTVARLSLPLLVGFSLSLFAGPLVDNAFATQAGVGGVAALAYARKIVETLTSILPYTLGLVLLPFSAEMAAARDGGALSGTLTAALRAMTLLFLPVAAGLVALREPLVQVLFERGAFTSASTQLTAGPLLFYALALVPFALEVVIVPFYFARQDTLTPVIADVVAFALNVALIPLLMPALGLGGIALAAAVAKALKVLALLLLYQRRVPAFRLAALGRFARQMVGSLAAAAAALAVLAWLAPHPDSGILPQSLYLSAAGIAGGGAFIVAAYLLGVDEVRALWRKSRRRATPAEGNQDIPDG